MSAEKIQIKSSKDVTVGKYFTNLPLFEPKIGQRFKTPWKEIVNSGEFSYALKGSDGKIVEILDMMDGHPIRRSDDKVNFRHLTEKEIENSITGSSFTIKFKRKLPDEEKNNIVTKAKNELFDLSGSSFYSAVFFEDVSAEDYNVDITIERTFDTLDTLSVKNNPLSEYPTQEAEVGTLYGTLKARQQIVDEDGERINIPLSNVPVVLFNESEEFPQISSTDNDGNRISLNMLNNSTRDDYFNIESFVMDAGKIMAEDILGSGVGDRFEGVNGILKSDESKLIPDKFKYSTVTNEKGEFVLHNVPIGPQTLMFEVDLLKQGMTKEEVALNFFPYPSEVDPNIDNIPHFFFRQIPVNIVPSWGDFQTGYTRVDITASIDMRKWVTFFVPPIAFGDKFMDDLLIAGYFDALNVVARDMTRQDYPLASEVVEIDNIYDRNIRQRMEWYGEFKVQKPKIEFRKNDYQAFKLPANLYDPDGIASETSDRRKTKENKGVWLCSYQMKMNYGNLDSVTRTTGFVRSALNDEAVHSSHFDLNRGPNDKSSSALGKDSGFSVGDFPYEQPWTISYPEPYKIPKRPVRTNTTKSFSDKIEPRFFDGDMAGEFTTKDSENPGGYGVMRNLEDKGLIPNKFSQSVTKGKVYKYEGEVAWHEEYSNGYRRGPHYGLYPSKRFVVENGEKYQRVEAGFAYWLRPEGWGRIEQHSWGDIMLGGDIDDAFSPVSGMYPDSYLGNMFRDGERIAIKLDTSIEPKWLQNGALDIYRVIEDTPDALMESGPPFIKKAIKIAIGNMWHNKKKTDSKLQFETAGDRSKLLPVGTATVSVLNNGSVAVEPTIGGVTQKVNPGEIVDFQIFSGADMILPSNTEYNVLENFYGRSNYSFTFRNAEIENSEEVYEHAHIDEEADKISAPPTFYLVTSYSDAKGNVKVKKDKDGNETRKCKNSFQQVGTYELNGLAFERTGSRINSIHFREALNVPDCTTAGIEIKRMINLGG